MLTAPCLTDPGYIAELRANGDNRSLTTLRRLPRYAPDVQRRQRGRVAAELERVRRSLRE